MIENINQGVATLLVGIVIGLIGVIYTNIVRRIKNCEDLDKTINGQLGNIAADVKLIKAFCRFCPEETEKK